MKKAARILLPGPLSVTCGGRLPAVVAASAPGAVELPPRSPVTAAVAAATTAALAPWTAAVAIGHDPVATGDPLRFLEHGLSREVDTPLAVDLGDLDFDLVAAIDPVLG